MSGLFLLRALLFAGECFLASVLLPLFAFAVSLLLRRRAALRHLAWTTMFGVLAVLPLAALLLPPRRIVEHVAAPVTDTLPAAAPVMAVPALAPPSLFTLENIVLLLAALWLAGLAWQGLRLIVGGVGLMRLRRASAPFAVELQTRCAVRLAAGEVGPSTFGILRPTVLLPRSATGWTAPRLEAVLRHEAAHVARRDTLCLGIARLVCAVFWPNPLLWLGLCAARRDAEIAADDAVLAGGMTPSLYAAELLGLAAESRGLAPGIAMARPPLSRRVQSVLAENSSRKGVTRMDIAKTALVGLTAALLLGAARFDIAVAEDAAPLPPVPAAEQAIQAQGQAAAAQADRVKARADRVAAQAKAKAEAETDPVKRDQYRAEAAQVAAQSAKVKAEADKAAAQYAVEARKHMALAMQLAGQMREQAQLAADRAGLDAERMRLAETMPRSYDRGGASGSAESTSTINGVTTTVSRGGTQNSNTSSEHGPTAGAPRAAESYFSLSNKGGVSIDIEVNRGIEEAMNRPEVRDAIRDAVDRAMMEAHRKIDIAIAEARQKAGLPQLPREPVAPVPPGPPPHPVEITPLLPPPPAAN